MRIREKSLASSGFWDSAGGMIRGGFLSAEDRMALIALARDGSTLSRVTRRANALVRLDDGKSCQEVAEWLLLDDDTIRGWRALFERSGLEGLSSFDAGGSSGLMNAEQTEALKAWVNATLPRSTRHIGAWICKEFGLVYESRSGLVALLHRLGQEYRKPEVISRKLDEETQQAQIAIYEDLLNSKGDDEVVVFVDAVHPTHAARPVGCWAPKEQNLAIEQTSGRERINIHGAVDLETGQTRMIEVETVDAISTIRLLESLQLLYPLMSCIHVFLDNARYHHAKLVKEWLARPGCRIKLHFLPAYCPHLNPIERLWGVMHKNITHNKTYGTCKEFAEATLDFLRDKVPRNWAKYSSTVTDNFRVISPKNFRVIA
jgi:transposase